MWDNSFEINSTKRKIGTAPTPALDVLHNAGKTTVKFRTVLLTLLIGNRLAASLLFLGFFCWIFVAQNVGVAADEETALGARKNAPYSINDKTQENASSVVGDIRTTVPAENVEDGALGRTTEPLPLGRRAFERRADANEERRSNATRLLPFELSDAPRQPGDASERREDEPRVVRQNAYSGAVVFYELSNGLRVLLKKTKERRVGIRVVLRDVGPLGEREAAGSGLAATTAWLVAENANEILQNGAAGDCGARLRSRVGREGTVLAIDVAEERFETALAATTDALWRS
ncbi:MAG: hypothetical protein IKY61_05090, partial [Thermoguttaceae bacterium]|nr:hypothetical protein [Thermoguttaceae bacterium]